MSQAQQQAINTLQAKLNAVDGVVNARDLAEIPGVVYFNISIPQQPITLEHLMLQDGTII